tara:strand:+ start:307 stop:567 length:261 start_codon:yes stop_codon:yes gene_type:complete
MKDDAHIINYILKTQDYWRYRKFTRKARKWKADNTDKYVFVCDQCKCLWEKVDKFRSKRRFTKYSKNIMPTIGKKKKTCPDCHETI